MDELNNIKSTPGVGAASSAPDPEKQPTATTQDVIVVVRHEDSSRLDALKVWLRENEVSIAEKALSDDDRLSGLALALYPAVNGGCLAVGDGCFAGGGNDAPVYLLGDTHGDFDSFVAILDWIVGNAENDAPTVYLLGDVIDRNGEGCMLECALIMAILQKGLPEETGFAKFNGVRLGIVKGDHDIALRYQEPYVHEKRFLAAVSPADYCDWLNKRLDDGAGEDATKIGRAWIRLMRECPAAAFLEHSGTLLAHGGIPRRDIQERIVKGELDILQSDVCAKDYEWCRLVDVKNKLLNRNSATSEIGWQEFDSFCKTVFPSESSDGCGTKVRRFVFGHQHPISGFERYTKWYDGYEVVCIASFQKSDSLLGDTIPHFCRLARKDDEDWQLQVYRMENLAVPDKEEAPAGEKEEPSASEITQEGGQDGAEREMLGGLIGNDESTVDNPVQ